MTEAAFVPALTYRVFYKRVLIGVFRRAREALSSLPEEQEGWRITVSLENEYDDRSFYPWRRSRE